MSRFVFEEATDAHDADLRRLFAANEMEGEIAVSFRREPSFFHATGVQGAFHQVWAARDTRTGEIIGVSTRAVRPGFLNGRVENVGYLADMRLDARYRGGTLVARAYRTFEQLHADGRARLYFTVIMEGNRLALETIAQGRAGIPPYRDLGRLLSPAVNLLRRKPPLTGLDFEIVPGSAALLPDIVACLQRNLQRRQFAPRITAEMFGSPALRDLRIEDFLVARRGDTVIGVVGKWDQSGYKQTVVTRYEGAIRRVRPIYNRLAPLLGTPRFPEPGQPLRSFYAAFPAIDDDDLRVFRALLRRLYNDHVGTEYAYFLIGLHERDPLAATLADFRLTPFAGRLFAVHFADGAALFEGLDDRPPYVELAAL